MLVQTGTSTISHITFCAEYFEVFVTVVSVNVKTLNNLKFFHASQFIEPVQ